MKLDRPAPLERPVQPVILDPLGRLVQLGRPVILDLLGRLVQLEQRVLQVILGPQG